MSETVLICIISSTAAAAVVSSVKELILWRLNRKAKLADDKKENIESEINEKLESQQKSIDKLSEKIDKVQDQMKATVAHDKIILDDKIRYLITKYLEYGEITLDERQAIHHMWDIYHYGLGGNGDLDEWMALLDEIPLKDGVHVYEKHSRETSVQ